MRAAQGSGRKGAGAGLCDAAVQDDSALHRPDYVEQGDRGGRPREPQPASAAAHRPQDPGRRQAGDDAPDERRRHQPTIRDVFTCTSASGPSEARWNTTRDA